VRAAAAVGRQADQAPLAQSVPGRGPCARSCLSSGRGHHGLPEDLTVGRHAALREALERMHLPTGQSLYYMRVISAMM
jgi:hypothetical protein